MQSSLHISPFTFRTEKIPKLKSQNSKSSTRIPQSLNLFPSTIYDSTVQQSTTDTLQQPSSFLFFHHPRRPFHQPPWEPESTQQQWRLSSLHQVSYSVYLFHLLQKFIGSLFSVGNYQPTSARGAFFFPCPFLTLLLILVWLDSQAPNMTAILICSVLTA